MQTQTVYFVGNSVTDTIRQDGLVALAASRGNTHVWGRHMIPGSSLSWTWEHPDQGFMREPYGYYRNALTNYQWDSLSLQPFDRRIAGEDGDLAMIGNYLNLAKPKSPNVQLYIYQRWPRKTDEVKADGVTTADEWNMLWLRNYDGGWSNNETRDYFSDLTQVVRTTYTDVKPALVVPVGDVYYVLNNKMKSGQIPGYNNIWQLYVDDIHMGDVGAYVTATTFYATLYRENPVGLPVPAEYGSINPSLVRSIQETVWEVVSNFDLNHPPNPGGGTGGGGTGGNPVNRSPIAVNDSFMTSEGQTILITLSALLANDSDPDNEPLTLLVDLTTVPTNGRLSRTAEGDYLYTSNAGFSGTDQFRYTIRDRQGATSQATVSLTLKPAIVGNASANALNGTMENDTLRGRGGNDRIQGRSGQDLIFGEGGDDTLLGEAGSDTLIGGVGDDYLAGVGERDRLTGNGGQDRFVLSPSSQFDTVTDFVVRADKIVVSKASFRLTQEVGVLSANSFRLGTSATTTSDRFIYDQAQGRLFFDADGVGGGTAIQIAELSNRPALRNTDFAVVA